MTEPKFLMRALVVSAVKGGVVIGLIFAMFAFAIPGPGGWAAWRVGLFAAPFGCAVGVIAYLLWLEDQITERKRRR